MMKLTLTFQGIDTPKTKGKGKRRLKMLLVKLYLVWTSNSLMTRIWKEIKVEREIKVMKQLRCRPLLKGFVFDWPSST